MTFDRRSGFFNRTLAWRLFKRHHTHFNDIFWANRAASKFAYAATRPHQRQTSAGVLFSLPGNHQRLTQTLGDWADNYSDFNQWTQLASVVAICGYLETYLAQISTAALESSPALIFGASSLAVDGTALLKAGNKYDFYQHVVPIVRGDWGARSAAYGRIFGATPFASQVGRLERLRTLRNDAGHSFGRNIESMRFSESALVQRLPKISDEDIQGFLELAETVASAVEAHLGPTYVGSFEVVRLYHRWRQSSALSGLTRRELAEAFSRYFNSVTQNPYGRTRGEGLIRYYEGI